MSKFKVGDKVRCISNIGAPLYFVIGKIYKIRELQGYEYDPKGKLVCVEETEAALYEARFELVQEEKQMTKLINGRPMSELKAEPHRPVLGIAASGKIEIFEPDYIPPSIVEWAEIVKPEPKPDANGWWKFTDKMPENGSYVILWSRVKHDVAVGIWRDGDHTYFTHWKLWEGPCE